MNRRVGTLPDHSLLKKIDLLGQKGNSQAQRIADRLAHCNECRERCPGISECALLRAPSETDPDDLRKPV